MKCSDCSYYQHDICRRYPPKVFLAPPGGERYEMVWPEVYQDNWCGEFRPIEVELKLPPNNR